MDSSELDFYLTLEYFEWAEWFEWLERSLDGKAAANTSNNPWREISPSPSFSTQASTHSLSPKSFRWSLLDLLLQTSTSTYSLSLSPKTIRRSLVNSPLSEANRLSLYTMFSINAGIRAPANEEIHRFWRNDPKAKEMIKFFSEQPSRTPLLGESSSTSLEQGGTHCPGDRFIDPGNASLFDDAVSQARMKTRRREFGVSELEEILLQSLFPPKRKDHNPRLGPKGLDYLDDFERKRLFALRDAASRLGKTADNWMHHSNPGGDITMWIRLVVAEERKVDKLLATIHTNLRNWIMATMLEQVEFDKLELIAMLNTLWPPYTSELPSKLVSRAALVAHRNVYFRLILRLEAEPKPEKRAAIIGAHIHRMNSTKFHAWYAIRDALECYLELGGIEIRDAELICLKGYNAFRRDVYDRTFLAMFAWSKERQVTKWSSLAFNKARAYPEDCLDAVYDGNSKQAPNAVSKPPAKLPPRSITTTNIAGYEELIVGNRPRSGSLRSIKSQSQLIPLQMSPTRTPGSPIRGFISKHPSMIGETHHSTTRTMTENTFYPPSTKNMQTSSSVKGKDSTTVRTSSSTAAERPTGLRIPNNYRGPSLSRSNARKSLAGQRIPGTRLRSMPNRHVYADEPAIRNPLVIPEDPEPLTPEKPSGREQPKQPQPQEALAPRRKEKAVSRLRKGLQKGLRRLRF